jgi:glycerol uptake facilitator-like aquaporin
LSDTFAGIAPAGVLPFIAAQILGALFGLHCAGLLYRPVKPGAF